MAEKVKKTPREKTRQTGTEFPLTIPEVGVEVERIRQGWRSFTREEKRQAHRFLLDAKQFLAEEIKPGAQESLEGLQEVGEIISQINQLIPAILDEI